MGMILAKNSWAERYVIVTDTRIDALHGERVQAALEKADLRVERIAVPPGEAAKEIGTVLAVTEKLTALGADRQTALIALGGGVIGDLTGFAASIYMRGIPVIQVPTTLLAQVDSSIGGKTGVDTAAGQEPPRDLPPAEGGLHRHRLPADAPRRPVPQRPRRGDQVRGHRLPRSPRRPGGRRGGGAACGSRRSSNGSSQPPAGSRRSSWSSTSGTAGLRRILNFGHTVGHAVEAASGYALSHGESVAIGMVAAAGLSEELHHLPADDRRRIAAVIRALGLPDRIPGNLDLEEIRSRITRDKKKKGETVHFVLLKKLGVPFVNGGIPENMLTKTLEGLKQG